MSRTACFIKTLSLTTAIIASLSTPQSIYAAVDTSTTAPIENLNLEKKHSTQVKLVSSSYKYTETIGIEIVGRLAGLEVEHQLPMANAPGALGIYAEYLAGTPEYRGSTFGGTPASHESKDYTYTLAGRWIQKAQMVNGQDINYSAGLAHRYFNDKGQASGAYEREQTYLYVPLTVGLSTKLSSRLELRGGLELDIFLHGKNTSHLGDAVPGAPTLEMEQGTGSGSKLTVGLDYELTDSNTIITELFYRTWKIADSDTDSMTDSDGDTMYFMEPENKTTMFGLAVGMTF